MAQYGYGKGKAWWHIRHQTEHRRPHSGRNGTVGAARPGWAVMGRSHCRQPRVPEGFYFRTEISGAGELSSFAIMRSPAAPQPLTTRLAKSVPLGAIEQTARQWIGDWLREFVGLQD